MGEIKGFLRYQRQDIGHRPVEQRIHDFAELDLPLTPEQIVQQTARCMDCGIPFCHGVGCPLGNLIPDINDLVYKNKWRQACDLLHTTNNFPEITSRVCPAPCESSCTLSINDKPVLIRHIEFQTVERGFAEGWIRPLSPKKKTGKKIAVIGSGPAGLAAAQQLVRAGHHVVVFEKDAQIGGVMRYGIPDFKLGKNIITRRLNQLAAEGIDFQTGVNVGVDISASYLKKMFDCICLTMGANQPRDLNTPGRSLGNIFFAMDYLKMQNKLCAGEQIEKISLISAENKNVVVIGGGDTGSDCVGTAKRQGAKQIYQLEILPQPPEARPDDTPWPMWPRIMRTSSSHEEGCNRQWSVITKQFLGKDKKVKQLQCGKVEWFKSDGSWKLKELPGTDFTIDADLVLLALGFLHVTHTGLVNELALKLDKTGNVAVNNYQTSEPSIFAAGDTVNGASLVVRAIDSGRQAAAAIDNWLKRG